MAEVDDGTVDQIDPNMTPEALAAWAVKQSMETTGATSPDEGKEIKGDGEGDEVDPEGDDSQEADDGKAATASPAKEGKTVVLAKDGKNTLPFSVVTEARGERDAAKAEAEAAKKQAEETARELAEARAQLEALQKQEKAGTATAAAASQSADELEASIASLEKEADALEEESPYLAGQQRASAKVMRSLLANTRALEQRLAQDKADAEKREQEAQQRTEAEIKAEVEAALNGNKALAHWREHKPAFFNEAANLDKSIRQEKEWQNKPLPERFAEVVRRMTAEYGEAILPPGSKGSPKPKADKLLPDGSDLGDVKTLTDFSGGTPTAQNPLEDLENASPHELSRAMEKMTPEEIARMVARAGT